MAVRTVRRPAASARRFLLPAAGLLLAVTLAGCGGGDDAPAPTDVRTIEITVSGGTVTPADERIDVAPGQPIDLVVTADVAGELHVHSSPEQEFEYAGDGETTTIKLQIDRPGVVEVETHDPQQVVATLTVQ
ncbi:hypothetical protein [Nocardioides sp.]|uniref:hypothetical protein n=1 Tax=Nocardioides sp. TaxID=35761 RepID=UPI00351175E1